MDCADSYLSQVDLDGSVVLGVNDAVARRAETTMYNESQICVNTSATDIRVVR